MNWYYAINGTRQGPIAQSEFEKLVSTGVINPQTLVWKEGMSEWKPYSSIAPTLPPVIPAGGGAADAPAAGSSLSADDTAVCAVSGKTFPKREMIQYEGRWVGAPYRDEFFQRIRQGMTPLDTDAVPGPYGYGGFWRRFCAKFLDGIILYAISIPINMVLSLVLLGSANYVSYRLAPHGGFAALFIFQGASILSNIALNICYMVFFIRKYQATPGKLALGMKLVRSDGSHLTKGRIVGRYFAEMLSSLILLIGYIMAAFDPEKKALHDNICDTRVIKTRS
jgi:uncharacterized RDD family membrane protein YckC